MEIGDGLMAAYIDVFRDLNSTHCNGWKNGIGSVWWGSKMMILERNL